MGSMAFDARKMNRIARRIVVALSGDGGMRNLVIWCAGAVKDELKSVCGKYHWQTDMVYSSWKDGRCMAQLPLDAWSLYDVRKFAGEYCTAEEAMLDGFVFDAGKMFDSRFVDGYGVLEDIGMDERKRLVNDSLNCPEDIREKYDIYEAEWMGAPAYRLVLQVEFLRMNKSKAFVPESMGDFMASVSFFLADEHLTPVVAVSSDSVEFNRDEDPRESIAGALSRAVSSI